MSQAVRILWASLSVALVTPLFGQGLGAYLPPGTASKAAKIVLAIDKASQSLSSKRAAARSGQLEAESIALEAFALISAAEGERNIWARPDGGATSAQAPEAYEGARAKAKALAKLLSLGNEAEASLQSSSDGNSAALAKLILSSGIGARQASALARSFMSKSGTTRLFPEVVELLDLLGKAGATGAREAAAASAYGGAASTAEALILAKPRILALEPKGEEPLGRLEGSLEAYRAISAAAYLASYPGDLYEATEAERAAITAGVSAMASLPADRAALLVEAMASGDGRDAAAAAAARRLAEAWARSSESGRREIAFLCASSEGALASFASSLASTKAPRQAAQRSEALDIMTELGSLSSIIADEEASSSGRQSVEPALVLLEKPTLAHAARDEPRYESLHAEASRRIGAVYAQSSQGAASRLESTASIVNSARAALGSAPTSLVVRSVDLMLPTDEMGRRLAFIAIASDASGLSISLPLDSTIAGEAYALAFAKAAGIDISKAQPSILLSRYRQCVVSAYAPESSNGQFVIESFPKGIGPIPLDYLDLELALVGGWRP
jgi:hypothetical protein